MTATAPTRDVTPAVHRSGGRRRRAAILRNVLLTAGALVIIYPVLWLVVASFTPENAIFSNPLAMPTELVWDNYAEGWNGTGRPFGVYVINSLIVCGGAVIGNILTCSMAAYAFARLTFPLKKVAFAVMLATIMLPAQVLLIPQFSLFRTLGWVDSYLPLIVPKFLAVDAFFIFLMVQFLRGIPLQIDEAARIDGCGPIATYWRVLLPLMSPALVTTAIFTFIWTYDDFFGQLIYVSSPSKFTVSLGLRAFLDSTGASAYGALLAMSVVAIVPALVIFILFQRRLVAGLTTSGIKG